MDNVAESKAALRRRMLAARSALPPSARAEASAAVCAAAARLPEVAGARVVLGYAAFGTECRIDALLGELSRRSVGVLLPWVDGEELALARVRDLGIDLEPGWRGVREPAPVLRRRRARPDRVEAAIVPGLAFDRSGARLGYGGGHFDRLLARLRPGTPVVGVAFSLQLVDSVPTHAHDRSVDILVTEREVHRVSRGR